MLLEFGSRLNRVSEPSTSRQEIRDCSLKPETEVVEAAGVEPASEKVTGEETTCLVQFMLLAFAKNVRGVRSERTRNANR
jgi:hypothetical protein